MTKFLCIGKPGHIHDQVSVYWETWSEATSPLLIKGTEWGDGGHLPSYLDLRLFIHSPYYLVCNRLVHIFDNVLDIYAHSIS